MGKTEEKLLKNNFLYIYLGTLENKKNGYIFLGCFPVEEMRKREKKTKKKIMLKRCSRN